MLPPFPTMEELNQTDDELGQDLLAWWIAYQAEIKGFDPYDVPYEIQEKIVLNTRSMDSDSVNNAGLEKAIIRATKGNYSKAGEMLRKLVIDGAINIQIKDECDTGKRRQKYNASKPRPDELQGLIIEIVAKKLTITVKELLVEILKHEGGDIVEEITEDEIFFIGRDGTGGKSAQKTGLKDRLTKARKKIKSP